MVNNIIPIVLITMGTAIMIYNIFKYLTLAKHLSSLHTTEKRFPKVILFVYMLLLIFFLLGYLIVGLSMGSPASAVSNELVGFIFFFGSIFVLIGLLMQTSMSQTIQKSSLEITQALITSVEARDANLNGHSVHVARLSIVLYDHLPREQQHLINRDDLEYAALLHDVGKLGVADCILNKEGPLEAKEWEEIRKHPQIGKNILSRLNCFEEVSDWVLYHHERSDGKGYLKIPKERIPYPSLIIAVVDTFSAITMKRSYREAKGYAKAAAILRECRGTQLDEELVDIFLAISETEINDCMLVENELEETASLFF